MGPGAVYYISVAFDLLNSGADFAQAVDIGLDTSSGVGLLIGTILVFLASRCFGVISNIGVEDEAKAGAGFVDAADVALLAVVLKYTDYDTSGDAMAKFNVIVTICVLISRFIISAVDSLYRDGIECMGGGLLGYIGVFALCICPIDQLLCQSDLTEDCISPIGWTWLFLITFWIFIVSTIYAAYTKGDKEKFHDTTGYFKLLFPPLCSENDVDDTIMNVDYSV